MLQAYKADRKLKALEGRLEEDTQGVKHALEEWLVKDPLNTRALFSLARCQQHCGEIDLAKRTFEYVLELSPRDVGARVELAKLLYAQDNVAAAIGLLEEATKAIPRLTENWKLLAEYRQSDGQDRAAADALKQHDMIKAFNDNLLAAEAAFVNGKLQESDQMCRSLLQRVPGEIRTLRILARIARQFRYYEASTSILERCIESRPDDASLGLDYARALLAGKKYPQVLDQCEHLVGLAPEMLEVYEIKAEALYNLGEYEGAMTIYRELSGLEEKHALGVLHLGRVLKTVGETGQAIDCFHEALKDEISMSQAFWELANLKTYSFTGDEVSAMKQLLEKDEAPEMDKILVQFSLGRALEDGRQFEQSFGYFQAANKAYAKYHPTPYASQNAGLKTCFTRQYLTDRVDGGNDSVAPIFVLGLPRSGSTLVEQILSAHSQVDATTELTEIISIARELDVSGQSGQGQYPDSIKKLNASEVEDYARRYLDFAAPLRHGGYFFIDKTPGNFHHVGLIKTLFPNARIIDIRRNPMASGWSLYKHFFADSFLFSYDLETIGRYYNDYIELMEHWHTVLPGQILTVNYEDLVNDLPGTVDTLLRYCGLPFEDSCLDFHLNTRAVPTPSSEQVRSPLYASALDHWKNYETFLQPLKQVIGENAPASES